MPRLQKETAININQYNILDTNVLVDLRGKQGYETGVTILWILLELLHYCRVGNFFV